MVEQLERVGNFTWPTTGPDTIRWRHNEDGQFSVYRVYKRGMSELAGSFKGLWKAIWKRVAPTKVKCFSWLVVKKECLTHETL